MRAIAQLKKASFFFSKIGQTFGYPAIFGKHCLIVQATSVILHGFIYKSLYVNVKARKQGIERKKAVHFIFDVVILSRLKIHPS